MKKLGLITVSILFLIVSACKSDTKKLKENPDANDAAVLSDKDIANAYVYLLGRDIILKQVRIDFENEGFNWNTLVYRTPGGVAWANPNLDVAYSEAWIAIDENSCALVEIPKIKGRYYTWHMLNGWGETILNINERTFPDHPNGKFAICLKGSNPKIPEGAFRVDIPCKVSRVLARVELGKNIDDAVKLQKQFRLSIHGKPAIDKPMEVPIWEGLQLPGVELFDKASAILATENDINEGMDALQTKVKATEALVNSGQDGKKRVEKAITDLGKPAIFKKTQDLGMVKNGWTRAKFVGNYHDDYLMRTVVNMIGLWANNNKEATYFGIAALDGSKTLTLTFPKEALPKDKAKYFWSIIAVDNVKYQVLPNSLKRYLLNKESGLQYNLDGSLTLVFGPKAIERYPQSNWLPTIEGKKYNLTFRFYGPNEDVVNGTYFPPQIKEIK